MPMKPARATSAIIPSETELAEQYRYVYQDLRRIATLAGSLIAVLVVLHFILG